MALPLPATGSLTGIPIGTCQGCCCRLLGRARLACQVWVRAAVTQGTEPRAALEVGEWALEPVLGNPQEMALSLTLADASCVTFVLQAHDMQDIAAALRRLQPRNW